MKIFLPMPRLNFSQIAYRKAREKSSFPLIILINFFQVLPQEPDEAAMALKLTLPQLGGGLKTSRDIFQPRTLNSPQTSCAPTSITISSTPLSKHLIEGHRGTRQTLCPPLTCTKVWLRSTEASYRSWSSLHF